MTTKTAFSFLAALAIIIGSSMPAPALACSVIEGYHFATPQEVLDDGGSMIIGKVLSSGTTVVGELIKEEKGTAPKYIVLHTSGTSCDDRFQFDKDFYFVAVSPKDEISVINHSSLDKQMSYFYQTQAAAEAAATALVKGETPQPSDEPKQSTYVPAGQTLRLGMKGDDVWKLQDALNRVLPTIAIYPPVYPANPDGVYGKQTMQAVMNFQRQANLTVDGIAGIKTQQALADALMQ